MTQKVFYEGKIYHVFNKSIANYTIFNSNSDYLRFTEILSYYNSPNHPLSLSKYLKTKDIKINNILQPNIGYTVKFISYCIMPDHYHLLFKVSKQDLVYKYMNDIGNSYSRYFNVKHNRKGPLWQSAYKLVEIINNNQLLHVSRYIHLNPVTSFLVNKPEQWICSSYNDLTSNNYLSEIREISINDKLSYKNFVTTNIGYQRTLKSIKKLMFE